MNQSLGNIDDASQGGTEGVASRYSSRRRQTLFSRRSEIDSQIDGERQEAAPYKVIEKPDEIRISTPHLEAAVRKRGYVSGVRGGSFTDKKTGFHDPGFGLDIVDWIMEPGSDQAYRDQLEGDLAYHFNTPEHGRRSKRSIEGPQICTQAKELSPEVIRGNDFVAIRQQYKYHLAAPGKKTGSTWTQWIVFPKGKPDPGKRLPEKGERPSREVMANTDRSNLAVVWPNRS